MGYFPTRRSHIAEPIRAGSASVILACVIVDALDLHGTARTFSVGSRVLLKGTIGVRQRRAFLGHEALEAEQAVPAVVGQRVARMVAGPP
jgi:hypothetical protein